MNYLRIIFVALLLWQTGFTLMAQDGEYDVRLRVDTFDCEQNAYYVYVEVKAGAPNAEFYMSDQNYRISYSREMVGSFDGTNVWIEQEETISGVVFQDLNVSFFDPHTLNGSIDTVLSYNVVLSGGTGYLVTYDEWVTVGKLGFAIDPNKEGCLDLTWHTHSPVDYPPTFIGEKVGGAGGILLEVDEHNYENHFTCTFCIFPVELVSFDAENIDNNKAKLSWTTATEINNSHFDIQRKVEDKAWETIGRVDGNGTTSQRIDYTFFDEEVPQGSVYYRLKQVDFDGGFDFSDVEFVRFGAKFDDDLVLFPNPVQDAFTLSFSDSSYEIEEVELLDMSGRSLMKKIIDEPINEQTINVEHLVKGMYLVKVTLNVGVTTRRIIR